MDEEPSDVQCRLTTLVQEQVPRAQRQDRSIFPSGSFGGHGRRDEFVSGRRRVDVIGVVDRVGHGAVGERKWKEQGHLLSVINTSASSRRAISPSHPLARRLALLFVTVANQSRHTGSSVRLAAIRSWPVLLQQPIASPNSRASTSPPLDHQPAQQAIHILVPRRQRRAACRRCRFPQALTWPVFRIIESKVPSRLILI